MQLFTVTADAQAVVADILGELDLTDALASALWRIDPDGPAPGMRDLARTLRCDPSTVTFLVERLQERGLVRVETASTDRRRRVVVLTATGRRVRRSLIDHLITRSPLAALSTSQQQRLQQLLTTAGAKPEDFICQATVPQSP